MAGQRESLKQQLHDELLKKIITMDPEAGEILTEAGIMEEFGASKSTTREALLTLCCENVLRNLPRCGYQIVRLSRDDVQALSELRTLVEQEGLRRSFDYIRSERLPELQQFLQETRAGGGSRDVWEDWENNRQFHLLLLSFCGNKYFSSCLAKSLDTQKRAFAQAHWQQAHTFAARSDFAAHERIVEAISRGNLEEALEALEKDIRHSA